MRGGDIVTPSEVGRDAAQKNAACGQQPLKIFPPIAGWLTEFEHLLSLYGGKHQQLLHERAKDGDTLFDSSLSIQELLWLADDTIEFLASLAIHRSKDCEYYADPALISTSHVEHTNLSVRLFNRRYTRLTLGYSKISYSLKTRLE